MKVCAALVGVLASLPVYAQAPSSGPTRAREAVSAQVAAYGGYPIDSADPQPYQAGDIALERLPDFPRPLTVWRATVPVDHASPWLVALAGDRLLRLGGFESVSLLEADSVLAASTPELKRRARFLAKLADKYGADSLLFPADSGPGRPIATARRFWDDRKPADWTPDTLIHLRDGRTIVSITTFSQNARSFGGEWHAFRYQFVFDTRRRLIGWSLVEQWPAAA